MPQELKALTINLKSLDQDIPDPIAVGGANANGRTFRIIFSQEAAAQMSDDTIVYLKWKHLQKKIQGYEAFIKISDDPVCWEIKWSTQMMRCGVGEVICDVELVDDVSIAATQTFLVHILEDPHDGSNFILSDEFTVFQQAVIHLTTLADKIEEQAADEATRFAEIENTFSEMQDDFAEMQNEFTEFKTQVGNDLAEMQEDIVEVQDDLAKKQTAIDEINTQLDTKLDTKRCGIEFDEEIPTIKAYVDSQTEIITNEDIENLFQEGDE